MPDPAGPRAAGTFGALCEAARAAGLDHLVPPPGCGERHAKQREEILCDSGIAHTIARPAWVAQNFSGGFLRASILAGGLPTPGEDVADVVAAALTKAGRRGWTFEVMGPRLITFADVARALSRAVGRPRQNVVARRLIRFSSAAGPGCLPLAGTSAEVRA